MCQEINYFLWGGSESIEKKGGYRRNNYCTWWIIGRWLPFVDFCRDRPSTRLIPVASASLAWSFSQYAISAGTLVAIEGRDGGELMVLGEEVPHENGG